jgi:acyl-CoA thioester hydrolase
MSSIDLHQNSIRIYSEDVDYMGIVYHANYVRYLERARTELLREKNLLLSDLKDKDILFAIKNMAIKYIFPARLDDLLIVTTEIKEVKYCAFTFAQTIKNQNDQLVCEATIQAVCVDGNLKPKRLPEIMKQVK